MEKVVAVMSTSLLDVFNKNGTIRQRCNKLLLRNIGNYTVYLFRGYPLYPGDPFEIGDENPGVIHDHVIDFHFADTLYNPDGPDLKCMVVLQQHRVGEEKFAFPDPVQKTEFFIKENLLG
ncbi:MAG: hypothetical protein HOP11_09530 [Saprospiraceae bacterium]|nr:hypothetical protein [Saprospiraceae bacterium]